VQKTEFVGQRARGTKDHRSKLVLLILILGECNDGFFSAARFDCSGSKAFLLEAITVGSEARLKASTLFGEDMSDLSHSRVFTFNLSLIDSCIPQPVVVT
jgi:hypothetical protein